MSIYTRDNTNYQSMIDAMIRNKTQQAQREADRLERIGKLDADTAKGIASTIGKGLDYYMAYKEDQSLEDQLKAAEARRDQIRAQYSYDADYKPYSTTDEYKAAMKMKGYTPDYDVKLMNTGIGDKYKTGSTYIVEDAKDKWLAAHPGMTEADYDAFVEYMNSVYGGR